MDAGGGKGWPEASVLLEVLENLQVAGCRLQVDDTRTEGWIRPCTQLFKSNRGHALDRDIQAAAHMSRKQHTYTHNYSHTHPAKTPP
jgi:hypothetical protein